MDEIHVNENKADDRVRDMLVGLTHRTSRHGFLVGVFRIALSALGISLFPLLPVDRIIENAEACTSCSDCKLCNICGTLCGCYGGGLDYCPSCAAAANSWGGCCQCGPSRYLMSYIDCCTLAPNNCHQSGTCTQCCPKSQFVWCGASGWTYICTIAQVNGFC
jgi:hypothetical protein